MLFSIFGVVFLVLIVAAAIAFIKDLKGGRNA